LLIISSEIGGEIQVSLGIVFMSDGREDELPGKGSAVMQAVQYLVVLKRESLSKKAKLLNNF